MNYTKNLKDFAANIDIMYDNSPPNIERKLSWELPHIISRHGKWWIK
jgi:hypothetical protein